jgi:hypothetical protein
MARFHNSRQAEWPEGCTLTIRLQTEYAHPGRAKTPLTMQDGASGTRAGRDDWLRMLGFDGST